MSADGGEPMPIGVQIAAANAPRRKRRINWFAGGGGTSEGMALAFGEGPDAALNHWPTAVFAHMRHHPDTVHYCAGAEDVHPNDVLPGEEIGFAWFSPDCTDFSKAKGKALRSERRRGLAWVVVDWIFWRRPDVVMVENVPEFLGWGPLYRDGHPKAGERIPELEGLTFEAWKRCIEEMGGVLEARTLVSADYGDPTTRERLYIIIRFDGQPIVWPTATHAPRAKAARMGLEPWVGAWTRIDFSIPCPSIFMTREEAKAAKLRVNRPLKPATMRRVARGVDRFVIRSADPFIVPITNQTWGGDRAHDIRDPLKTVTTAKGGEFALAEPIMVSLTHQGDDRIHDPREPAPTVTAANRGEIALAAPVMAKFRKDSAGADIREPSPTITANSYQKRPGGAPPLGVMSATIVGCGGRRGQSPPKDVRDPAPTMTGKADACVAAVHLQRQFGASVGSDAGEPAGTVTAGGGGKTGVVAAYLDRQFGTSTGNDLAQPVPTLLADARGGKSGVIAANLISYYGAEAEIGSDLSNPGRTVTGKCRHAVSAAFMHQANTGMVGRGLDEPSSTIVLKGCTQQLVEARLALEGGETGRRGQVLAFLWQHFGEPSEAEWADPLATLEGRLKFGLVLLPDDAGGKAVWMIVDIGLRMLKPKELAGLMGMRADFDLDTDVNGDRISITDQTHLIGNMVTRHTSAALMRANCLPEPQPERSAA